MWWAALLLLSSVGVASCPGRCLCFPSSNLVNCQSRELTRVPQRVPHGAWLVDLSRNRLTEVQGHAFTGLWSLRILLLSNNSIHVLEPQSLSSLQFLETLDLSFNRLERLPPDFSQSLGSLLELRLQHNLLVHLAPPTMDRLENLRKLDLGHNLIRTLEAGLLNRLGHLRYLNLEGNRLSVLEDGLLARQQRLEVLRLGHNNISLMESEALAPLPALNLLGLRGNRLEHVHFRVFLGLRSTSSTYLQLSFNPWTCDCELHRVFGKIRHVRYLRVEDYEEIICGGPATLAGASLSSLDGRLCLAETSAVLVITLTVVLAVICALVKAKRSSASKRSVPDPLGN
ncbi:hypothetical protein NHX12_024626 [Muraenolepis orangiensis]|uniref:LRRNT domain-containing protein n=1 Tax=Muraenolepis orangiensis TaxID=630683 RepID=A0A9Q0EHQ6_9TELE|nr:hypothetical protein NHX12_024626 [Muraenolepis orangiensis]